MNCLDKDSQDIFFPPLVYEKKSHCIMALSPALASAGFMNFT
jgi:hypothetical protein